MSYQFKSYTGKNTDILHSKEFLSKGFKERERIAFDKNVHKSLSEKDRLLLQGYATATAQRNKAFSYNKRNNGGNGNGGNYNQNNGGNYNRNSNGNVNRKPF